MLDLIIKLTFLRGDNWMHFAIGHIALPGLLCYIELKLRYLKNLKLFPITVKELFEPMRRVFALFKSIFLRDR